MKTNKFIALSAGFILYLAVHMALVSYDNIKTHPAINEEILNIATAEINGKANSHLTLDLKDRKLNGMAVTNPGLFSYSYGESAVDFYPWEWITHGGLSGDEPETDAAIRHFYDPFALGGHKYLTNRGTYWEGAKTNPCIDAIEWAIGDTPKGMTNPWTWEKGKQFMADALNAGNPGMRDQLMAKAWRCLGETLHNTADMGCPPHVRNDSHAAPLGWSAGALLGSPDPYEERFNSLLWVGKYSDSPIDDEYAYFLKNATTARQINEKLAVFTNINFFSNETISGVNVLPENGENPFVSPKLEDLSYNADDYTYYKTFPSGRKVKMCRDFRFFSSNHRGKPYIDDECVKSQASELVPYIVQSGKRVFELFIPGITIEIKLKENEDVVECKVSHLPDAEYKDELLYNGDVKLKSNGKEYIFNCINGRASQAFQEKPGPDWEATIEHCGLIYKYKSGKSSLSDYTNWTCRFDINLHANDGKDYDYRFNATDYSSKSLEWNNNTINAVWDTVTKDLRFKATLYFEADKDGKFVKRIVYDEEAYETSKVDGFDLWGERKFHIEVRPIKFPLEIFYLDLPGFGYYTKILSLNNDSLFSNVESFNMTHKYTEPVRENGKIVDLKIIDLSSIAFNKSKESVLSVALLKKK